MMMMMMMNKTTTCLIMSGIESCDNLCAMIRALKNNNSTQKSQSGQKMRKEHNSKKGDLYKKSIDTRKKET